ncbi:hypothetical protein CDD80_878 [Ophiocordyceps camponoti-rufipedis]|uniref:SAM domain-containing protein n=1 Tax=Ophiocordyceps camponoti-rufipedis TaxID=2004952 RepID=A0A2C5YIK5_9HYPO|nr:hypothetical protein CDD80_878 [Ophiocordyceps camponoti-rufipedis]
MLQDRGNLRAVDGRLGHKMRHKPTDESFYSKADANAYYQRPISVATEFVDIDWDEEITSDAEDNSPRVSLQSLGQPSISTVSSYDEAPTPRSSTGRAVLTEAFIDACPKQVQGPRGPHLFRSSTDPSFLDEDLILTLSPLAPQEELNKVPERSQPLQRESPAKSRRNKVDSAPLLSWTPEMVAQFMIDAGIDVSVADRFIENDISGEIVMTLKFEDLRELDIASFGIRTKVWHQIQFMRDSRPSSPRPSTPIEDVPSREARNEARAVSRTDTGLQSQRLRRRPSARDDGVAREGPPSIIGIEQVIPKEHHCSKGENCSKWKRQQRVIDDFQKAHPQVDVKAGGSVVIFGDAGNPETARAIDPHEHVKQRPVSDTVQSVAASSDVFGPSSPPPMQYLQEAVLRGVRSRDPQDNVRQFLSFQYQQDKGADNEVPPTPPFELGPAATYPHGGLRRLPKLCIPGGAPPLRRPSLAQLFPPPLEPQPGPERSASCSPEVNRRGDARRLASPFSDPDVPVTAVPTGPVARNVSQSVPPELGHRASPPSGQGHARSQSRVSARRPSFPVLPALDEHKAVSMASKSPSPKTPCSKAAGRLSQQPLQAPPRFNYPCLSRPTASRSRGR